MGTEDGAPRVRARVVAVRAKALPPRTKAIRAKWTGTVYREKETGLWVAKLPRSGIVVPGPEKGGRFAQGWEAAAALDRAIGVLAESPPSAATLTSAWVRTVVEEREREGYRSARSIKSRVRTHVDGDLIGRVPIGEVTEAMARQWLARMIVKGGGGRGRERRGVALAYSTIKGALAVLRSAFERAAEQGLLPGSVWRSVRAPRPLQARTKESWTVLVPYEQERLEQALRYARPSVRSLVRMALYTGARRGELFSLEWCDVLDTDDLRPHVVIRWGAPGKATKGGKPRRVPLLGPALDAIARWRRETKGATEGRALVWPSKGGRPIDKPPVGWARALAEAEVGRHVRWHDLRHTACTSLLEGWWGRAWSVEEVRQFAGHTKTATTEAYVHARGDVLFKAAAETRAAAIAAADELFRTEGIRIDAYEDDGLAGRPDVKSRSPRSRDVHGTVRFRRLPSNTQLGKQPRGTPSQAGTELDGNRRFKGPKKP